ncbi:16S rRNA (adenine(1518)-N(6)/adenine(1519)-N(6))-dimethyltransferase RsmA [Vulcanisaeta thermophila]|uniref:16S rRNA (adenine(1518)-N(6)/adenine(1519)-N(6))- dimethyltransferase RsmA n=1 Tax=Vulcanisaeta thermophila TaxID=867917 RepID=UPI000853C6C5|nr:16S rRNA (adenine(1518)-N(6)/adenine(1519)-N(6))-dimethyltransferase RsmA [Vulcanisaeta thermophila]
MPNPLPELDLLTRDDLMKLVSRVRVRLRKSLSQHFVVDPAVIRDMVNNVPVGSQVLEVGTGIGTLTYYLARVASRVVSIEVDGRLLRYAENLLRGVGNVSLVSGDALRMPWPKVDFVVSNVPFSITSPLIMRIIREGVPGALLTIQREVANRIMSRPGDEDYGRLSVVVQCVYNITRINDYAPDAFYPSPEVYSSLVKLTRTSPCIDDLQMLELTTNVLFRHRNRKLRWVLSKYLGSEAIRRVGDCGVNMETRIRDLSINEIVRIAKSLMEFRDELDRLVH